MLGQLGKRRARDTTSLLVQRAHVRAPDVPAVTSCHLLRWR